ncbi:MAG: 30S ribosomal protein S17e [archaeon]
MGNAVSKQIKSKAKILLSAYGSEFSSDFEKNKKFITSLELPFSKPTKNLIAGFIARDLASKAKETS